MAKDTVAMPVMDDQVEVDPGTTYPEIVDSEACTALFDALDGGILDKRSMLTTARVRFIIDAIQHGGPAAAACAACGIAWDTFDGWRNRGKTGEFPFNAFAEVVYAAEGMAELAAARSVHGGDRSWAGPAAWLERRRRERWSPPDQIHQGAISPPVSIVFIQAGDSVPKVEQAATPMLEAIPSTPGGSPVGSGPDGDGGIGSPTRPVIQQPLEQPLEPTEEKRGPQAPENTTPSPIEESKS